MSPLGKDRKADPSNTNALRSDVSFQKHVTTCGLSAIQRNGIG